MRAMPWPSGDRMKISSSATLGRQRNEPEKLSPLCDTPMRPESRNPSPPSVATGGAATSVSSGGTGNSAQPNSRAESSRNVQRRNGAGLLRGNKLLDDIQQGFVLGGFFQV